jgi:hypothetical protein
MHARTDESTHALTRTHASTHAFMPAPFSSACRVRERRKEVTRTYTHARTYARTRTHTFARTHVVTRKRMFTG